MLPVKGVLLLSQEGEKGMPVARLLTAFAFGASPWRSWSKQHINAHNCSVCLGNKTGEGTINFKNAAAWTISL